MIAQIGASGGVGFAIEYAGSAVTAMSMEARMTLCNMTIEAGARVGLIRRGQDTLWRLVHTDSSYLSANDVRVHFGLGDKPEIDAIAVPWPDGSHERFEGIKADRIVTLKQGSGKRMQP